MKDKNKGSESLKQNEPGLGARGPTFEEYERIMLPLGDSGAFITPAAKKLYDDEGFERLKTTALNGGRIFTAEEFSKLIKDFLG